MYRIVICLLLPALISCSGYECSVINASHSLLSEISQRRITENELLITKIDSVIREQGEPEREIYNRLDNVLLKVDRGEFADKEVMFDLKHILNQTDFDVNVQYALANVSDRMDTVIVGAIKSMLKQRLINHYASMVGSAGCQHCNPVLPHLTFKSSVIQAGNPVELCFFLGPIGNRSKFFDERGGSCFADYEMKVTFFPDRQPGKYVWRGFCLNGKDTVDMVIPYRIMDCPDGNSQ